MTLVVIILTIRADKGEESNYEKWLAVFMAPNSSFGFPSI